MADETPIVNLFKQLDVPWVLTFDTSDPHQAARARIKGREGWVAATPEQVAAFEAAHPSEPVDDDAGFDAPASQPPKPTTPPAVVSSPIGPNPAANPAPTTGA